jgi:hypothetical protein
MITITNTITIVIAIAIAIAIITISRRPDVHTFIHNRWEGSSKLRWISQLEICTPQVRIVHLSCGI